VAPLAAGHHQRGQVGFPADGLLLIRSRCPTRTREGVFFCSAWISSRTARRRSARSTVTCGACVLDASWPRDVEAVWHGLYQPLGLRVVNDVSTFSARSDHHPARRERRRNEADRYENFSHSSRLASGHDIRLPGTRHGGKLLLRRSKGVHRISPDGQKMETLATGFRIQRPGCRSGGVITAPATRRMDASSPRGINPGYYGYGGPKVTASSVGSIRRSAGSARFDNSVPAGLVPENGARSAGRLLHFALGPLCHDAGLRDAVESPAQGPPWHCRKIPVRPNARHI